MMPSIQDYIKIKDDYVLYYSGNAPEIVEKIHHKVLSLKEKYQNTKFLVFCQQQFLIEDFLPTEKNSLSEIKKKYFFVFEVASNKNGSNLDLLD